MTTEPKQPHQTNAAARSSLSPRLNPKPLLFAAFGGIFGALLVVTVNFAGEDPPFRIGVVNIQDILERHIKDYAARNLTKEQQQQAAADFSQSLESEIRKLAKKEHLHLLVAPAVLSDVPDYTGYIEHQLRIPDDL